MGKSYENYIGTKFGKRTLISYFIKNSKPYFTCLCDCGNTGDVQLSQLKLGKGTQCCACSAKDRYKNNPCIIGTNINDWVVISECTEKTKDNNKIFLCRCKCGFISKKTKRQILKTIQCYNCSMKVVGEKKQEKYTNEYVGTHVGVWKITHRVKKNGVLCFVGVCKCGTEKISDSIYNFKNTTGCVKCCPKHNSKSLKTYFLKAAEKLVGTSNLYFKIIKVIGSEKGFITFLCKCLSCKKQKKMKSTQINTNVSCGCKRYSTLPKGQNHHKAKVSEIEVKSIRELFQSGCYTRKELSKQLNISKSSLCDIINNKIWKHV